VADLGTLMVYTIHLPSGLICGEEQDFILRTSLGVIISPPKRDPHKKRLNKETTKARLTL
jgi:hypothetical protein